MMRHYRSQDVSTPSLLALPSSPHESVTIVGILNVTPDSFSDGGEYSEPDPAFRRALEIRAEGAAVIDVGGESTRPGSVPVSVEEELKRVLPVVEKLREIEGIRISVDTNKAEVASAALDRGATIINDVTALAGDRQMADVVADADCEVVLMHTQGTPGTMQRNPTYDDVVLDVMTFLESRCEYAIQNGVKSDRIWIDPGIGFGKTTAHNLEIIRRIDEFLRLGFPVILGPSRKSFIGQALGLPVKERLEATAATCVFAALRGVQMVRVHDVEAVSRSLRMIGAIIKGIDWCEL